MGAMRALQRLVLLLLVYVAVDFANPLMPGAVSFNPDDSVEGVRASQARVGDAPVMAVPPRGPDRLQTPASGRPIARVEPVIPPPRERLGHRLRAPAPPPASAQSSEDH